MEKNVGLEQIKRDIEIFIRNTGPTLPSEISKRIGKSLIVTSAILNEMVREKRLKITNLKIGSSPIYFCEGQEKELEKFVKHLKQKEKEAVELLKEKKIIDNEKIDPSTRVALNNAKDFAKLVKVKYEGIEKIFWKYYLINKDEIEKLIKISLNLDKKKVEKEKEEKKVKEKDLKGSFEKEKKLVKGEKNETIEKLEKNLFEKYIYDNFNLIEKISNSYYIGTKDILDEPVEFIIIINKKKRISDADILNALNEGRERKMISVLLTTGKITKKAKKLLDNVRNLLIVKNLNEE